MKFKFVILSSLLILLLLETGCKNPFRYTDAREVPHDAKERVKKNIEEGRGVTLFSDKKKEECLILLLQMNCGGLQLKFSIL